MRIISGIVSSDGSISTGSGDFDVRKESRGLYTVIFRPPLKKVYGGSVTQIFFSGGDAGNTRDNAVIAFLKDGDMRLKTGNSDGGAIDRDFTFVVSGE